MRWRHGISRTAIVLALALTTACALEPGPFQAPVPGARSTTEWIAEDPSLGGVPGEALAADRIMAILSAQTEGTFPGAQLTTQLEDEEGGTIAGYIRAQFTAGDHPMRAVDTRFSLRRAGDGWEVDSLERRFHCATEEPSVDFCQ